MFGISDIAETVAMRKDRSIKRFMSNSSEVCEICCAISGHLQLSCIFISLLWPPCVTGQANIFLHCGFFCLLLLLLFPRLISAVAEWTSTHDVAVVRI